jgi:Secretion system C-terminal sorting domain
MKRITQLRRFLTCASLFFAFFASISAQTIVIPASGALTIQGGATSAATPWNYFWESRRMQFIYTKSEIDASILAAGGTTGSPITFNNLAWDVTIDMTSAQSLTGYTLKFAHTTATSLGTTFITGTGTATVFGPTTVFGSSSVGWKTFNLTNFTWNSTENLLVEVCWGVNSGYVGTGSINMFTPAAVTATGNISSTAQQCGGGVTPSTNVLKPRLQLISPLALDLGATVLATPTASQCFGAAENVQITIKNFGSSSINFATNPAIVTCNVTGAATQTFTQTINAGTLAPSATMNIAVGTLDMTAVGTYIFNANAVMTGDQFAGNNAMPAATRTVLVAPICPILTAPANNSTNNLLQPVLTWSAATGASSYDIYMTASASGGTDCATAAAPTFLANVSTLTYTLSAAQILVLGKFYKWFVVPKNYCGVATTGCDASPFCFKTFAAPDNDLCSGAIVIPNTSFPVLSTLISDITQATSTGDPIPACQASVSRGVWFSFTPAATSCYTIASCPEAPYSTGTTVSDNVLAVFTSSTGLCGGTMTQVSGGCDDDACTGLQGVIANLPMTAGVKYFILIYKYGTIAPSVGATAQQIQISEGLPMGLSSTLTTQITGTIPPAATNQQILQMKISTTGCGTPISVTGLNFTTTGTTNPNDLAAARVFFTGNSTVFATTTAFGTDIINPNGTFSAMGTAQLSLGDNYFWLVYDVACAAANGNLIDAVWSSATYSSGTPPTISGNPTGNRTVSTASVIYETVANGNWSALSTWSCIGIPPENSPTALNVVIKNTVLLDIDYSLNANFTVNAGKIFNSGNRAFTFGAFGSPVVTLNNSGIFNVESGASIFLANAQILNNAGANLNVLAGGILTIGTNGATVANTVTNNGVMTISGEMRGNIADFTLNGATTVSPGGLLRIGNDGGGARLCTVNAALTVHGTMNVNGQILLNSASSFAMNSTGILNIDPNDGTSTGSAALASNGALYIATPSLSGITGGQINFMDPPWGSAKRVLAYDVSTTDAVISPNCTVKFGDPAGFLHTNVLNNDGFYVECNVATGTLEIGTMIVNGGFYTDPVDPATKNRRQVSTNSNNIYITKARNLTINAGAELLVRDAPMAVLGNMLNNGLVTVTGYSTTGFNTGLAFVGDAQYSGGVNFSPNTTTAQSLTGTGFFRPTVIDPVPTSQTDNAVKQLQIWSNSTTAGFTLGVPLNVRDHLRLNSGKTNTTSTNLLSLGTPSGTILSGSLWQNSNTVSPTISTWGTTAWINGPFKRWTPNATTVGQQGIFPVGDATRAQIASVEFTNTPNSAGSLIAQFSSVSPVGGLVLPTPFAVGALSVTHLSPSGSWNISKFDGFDAGGTALYTCTLNANSFKQIDLSTPIPPAKYPECVILKRPNSSSDVAAWTNTGTNVATATTTGSIATIKRTTLQGFSEFALAGTTAALPIELTAFSGKINGLFNELFWETANEFNVEKMEIERAADGQNDWISIGSFASRGNSVDIQNYSILDRNPLKVGYYRLKTTDFDGEIDFSEIIALVRPSDKMEIAAIFPNPTTDLLTISFEILDAADINLEITDLTGRAVYLQKINAEKGLNATPISLEKLPSGIYFLKINDGRQFSEPKRVVKN